MATPAAPTYRTDEERWQAVVRKDRRADGAFVYSVRTTGVYCRPACPSRRPNRTNVCFFAAGEEAERAGFRACKKCRPAEATATPAAVASACRLIEAAEEPPSLSDLAGAVGLSRFHFHRLFRQTLGVTPKAYIAARRVEKLRAGLRAGRGVTAAMYEAGFGASSRLYEAAGAALGMTPGALKGGGGGEVIRYAVAGCDLGRVLVAATARGVCCVEFGDADDRLVAGLRGRFPRADLRAADPSYSATVAAVLAALDAPALGLGLPLDVRGTAFQRRVWEALRAVPPGTTADYADIARRVGRPTAVRAVARACAANPVAVVVPCHRVVRSDGDRGGYRWGDVRKAELLRREAGGHERRDGPGGG